ncbi:hypothetical protein CDEN61S_04010 [Castellaniella denitrificans]
MREGVGGVQVGVLEHDLRRLAAQFEHHRAVVPRGGRGHLLAGGGGAGEGDVPDAGMGAQGRAGLVAVAGDDVQRPGREAHAGGHFGQIQGGQAGVLGGLDHAGVAGRQGRADAAAEDLDRVVPGDDVAGDAVRLAHRHHQGAGVVGQGLAVQLVAGARVVFEVARQGGDVVARGAQRLAGVARLQAGQLVGLVQHGAAPGRQQAAPVAGAGQRPGAVEVFAHGRLGGPHGLVDVLGRAAGDAVECRPSAGSMTPESCGRPARAGGHWR